MAASMHRWATCFAIGVLSLGITSRGQEPTSDIKNPFLNAADPFVTRVSGQYLPVSDLRKQHYHLVGSKSGFTLFQSETYLEAER